MMQKRRLRRKYAQSVRQARRKGKLVAFGAGKIKLLLTKVATKTVAVVASPKALLALGAAAIILVMILGLISACSSFGSSIVSISYLAEEEDIDDAALLFSELEVDLKLEILAILDGWPDEGEWASDEE